MVRYLFARREVDRMLMLSIAFSLLMVVGRMILTSHFTFLFLVWNLFLAWIPYAITSTLNSKGWKFVAVFCVWILFIPNSFYILTDLFHLGWHSDVPLWYDLALIVSFAWNGLLLGILSVRQMEKIVQPKYEVLFIYPIMWLNAWGVYIGRYLRFNSWDIITNPFDLAADMFNMMWHPIQHKDVWGMVACYSVFMTLVYMTIKRINEKAGS